MGFSYRPAIPLLDSLLGRILPERARQYGGLRVAGSVSLTVVSVGLPLCGAISGDSSVSVLAAFAAAALPAAMAVWLIPAASAVQVRDDNEKSGETGNGLDVRF
jgi:predicted permease